MAQCMTMCTNNNKCHPKEMIDIKQKQMDLIKKKNQTINPSKEFMKEYERNFNKLLKDLEKFDTKSIQYERYLCQMTNCKKEMIDYLKLCNEHYKKANPSLYAIFSNYIKKGTKLDKKDFEDIQSLLKKN